MIPRQADLSLNGDPAIVGYWNTQSCVPNDWISE